MATVLNKPNLAYYQRRNHVRLPRRAQSKKFIDVSGVAIVPFEAFGLMVGQQGGSVGFFDSVSLRDTLTEVFNINSINSRLRIRFVGDAQLSGVTAITVSAGGASTTAVWNPAQGRYVSGSGEAAALLAVLQANVGQVLDVDVSFT